MAASWWCRSEGVPAHSGAELHDVGDGGLGVGSVVGPPVDRFDGEGGVEDEAGGLDVVERLDLGA